MNDKQIIMKAMLNTRLLNINLSYGYNLVVGKNQAESHSGVSGHDEKFLILIFLQSAI